MTFNFEKFDHILDEKKIEIVEDNYGQNYVLMVIQNGISIGDIDFDAFENEDVGEVFATLEEAITDENEDEEIGIDPVHPYSRIAALSKKISTMEDVPKVRATSPFSFL